MLIVESPSSNICSCFSTSLFFNESNNKNKTSVIKLKQNRIILGSENRKSLTNWREHRVTKIIDRESLLHSEKFNVSNRMMYKERKRKKRRKRVTLGSYRTSMIEASLSKCVKYDVFEKPMITSARSASFITVSI